MGSCCQEKQREEAALHAVEAGLTEDERAWKAEDGWMWVGILVKVMVVEVAV